MNPITGLLTIFFHVPLIFLAHNRPGTKGMISIEAAVLACLLSLGWLACFIVMVLISKGSLGTVDPFGLNETISTYAVSITQRLQFIGTPLEFGLLGDIAIRSTWARRAAFYDDWEEKVYTP